MPVLLWIIFLFELPNHIFGNGINLLEKEIQDNSVINTIYSDDPKLSYFGRFAISGK